MLNTSVSELGAAERGLVSRWVHMKKFTVSPFHWITLLRQSCTRDELVTGAGNSCLVVNVRASLDHTRSLPATCLLQCHHRLLQRDSRYSSSRPRLLLFFPPPRLFLCKILQKKKKNRTEPFCTLVLFSAFGCLLSAKENAGRLHRDEHAQLSNPHHCLFFVLQLRVQRALFPPHCHSR